MKRSWFTFYLSKHLSRYHWRNEQSVIGLVIQGPELNARTARQAISTLLTLITFSQLIMNGNMYESLFGLSPVLPLGPANPLLPDPPLSPFLPGLP